MSKWSETEINYLYDNYKILSHKEMAINLYRTQESIKLKCKKLRLLKVPRHIIFEKYFDIWSSDMSYILGFIMADGCIYTNKGQNSLKIDIHKKDDEILKFINSKISKYNIIKYNKRNHARLTIGSYYLINKLISYGIISRKTGYETIEYVPNEWKADFIRGYFDGDGSISIRKANSRFNCYICGSNLNLMYMLRDFLKCGKIENKSKNSKPFYRFALTRKCDLEHFRSVLYYRDDLFSLTRKREKIFSVNTTYIKRRKV